MKPSESLHTEKNPLIKATLRTILRTSTLKFQYSKELLVEIFQITALIEYEIFCVSER